MTREQIKAVFDRALSWPEDLQEQAAQHLLALERMGDGVYALSEEERADLEEALQEMERGTFASDEEVEAVFRRYR